MATSKSSTLSSLEKLLDELTAEKLSDFTSEEIQENVAKYDREHIDKLKLCLKNFQQRPSFQKGEIVTWKKHMRNKRLPNIGQPAIVVKTLDEPILQDKVPLGSTYYGELLDIVLGMIHEDGTFLTFYYDSIRFELYSETS